MTGHPDTDVLAEFREGLLGRRRSARIRAHLARCSRCAALDRGLAEVSTLLASAPAPRMPDELAARLEGVLAAEAAARTAQADSPAPARQARQRQDEQAQRAGQPDRGHPGQTPRNPGHPGQTGHSPGYSGQTGSPGHPGQTDKPGHPGQTPRRPGRSGRAARLRRVPALRAATAAAVILVVAGGGYGLSRVLQQPATTGASAAGRPGFAAGTSAAPKHAAASTNGLSGGRRAGSVPPVRSGIDYQHGQLAAQVEQVLSRPTGPGAPSPLVLSPADQQRLQGCVTLITGGARPRLVDLARYQGRPATIIVQATAGGRPAQAWVVGTGCSATSRDVIAHTQLTGVG